MSDSLLTADLGYCLGLGLVAAWASAWTGTDAAQIPLPITHG